MTESSRVSAFIEARQSQVLARAVVTLSTVDAAQLGAEAHRLAGTLGTFDLPDAAAALRELERIASAPDATQDDVARAWESTLATLNSNPVPHAEERP
jgi:HPt (histidine-containing phosphotransfer) domain-containing protein